MAAHHHKKKRKSVTCSKDAIFNFFITLHIAADELVTGVGGYDE